MNKIPCWPAVGCLLLLAALGLPPEAAAQETPAHVVVVIYENHSYDEIIGNSTEAPAFNQFAGLGAVFTDAHAIEHPSQPNYLDIFSGENQLVVGDGISSSQFTTANLGAELLAVGKTFADYSQTLPYSLPSDRNTAVAPGTSGATAYGFLGTSYSLDVRLNEYERKHNPAANWENDANPSANQLPSTVNQPFSAFPQANFGALPTVSFVIPDEQNDIHDGTITQGDNFLGDNLLAYAQWALQNNSLLIITFDEDDDEDEAETQVPDTAGNQIPTIIIGQNVVPGNYSEPITHFNVLQTLQDFYGTSHAGATGDGAGGANSAILPITDIFASAAPVLKDYVEFSAPTYHIDANAGRIRIIVKRVGRIDEPLSVHYRTRPGPGSGAAKPGANYKTESGTLSWPAGDAEPKTFEVKILDRGRTDKATRTFYVELTSPSNGALLGRHGSATVTIKENDPAPGPTP
jgi:hypothetical protein